MSFFVDLDDLGDQVQNNFTEELAEDRFMTAMLGFLDGRIRVQAYPPMDNRDWRNKALWAAHVLAAGVAIDVLAFVSDTYQSTARTKSDGSEWGYGEMGEAFRNGGPDAALVTEALIVHLVDRTGSAAMLTIPYTRKDGAIEFGERQTMTEGEGKGHMDGPLPDGLRSAMLQPSLMEKMGSELGVTFETFGLSVEQARMHAACAVVKILAKEGVPVALGANSEAELEVLRNSFEGMID